MSNHSDHEIGVGVYFDHASTTYLDPEVLEAMLPYFEDNFGNPSSFHSVGKRAKDACDEARKNIARLLEARAEEIVFTSGGSESNNLALLGIYRQYKAKGTHIITNSIEHHSVLETVEHLEKKEGAIVTYIPVDKDGLVDVEALKKALTPQTLLVSIMYANNEIGTIEPIKEIGRIIKEYKQSLGRRPNEAPFFHTDACQAAGFLNIKPNELGVDLMTINASKIYGPKGIGLLYIKTGIRPEPIIFGGGQENSLRSGTHNVPSIIGFAKALELAEKNKISEGARLKLLRDKLIKEILARVPKTRLNGHPNYRLPNNVHISYMDIEGEALVLYLDAKGIYASTGSACASTALEPSHVVRGIGLSYEAAHGSIRLSLGKRNTEADVDYFLSVIPGVVERLRSMSPVNLDMKAFS